jgi:predicted transcriptional regulator of viral defense system
MALQNPLKTILTPEFDYNIILDRLQNYRFPRNKIGSLLKSEQIIRVKKGLYVKTDEDYHPFVIANMMYGPSYISEDSALSYYGMIPEQVHMVTSTAFLRKRHYATPIGEFHFNVTQKSCYSFGIERVEIDGLRAYLIATPEKALFDRLYHAKGLDSQSAMGEYLFENMRLDISNSFNFQRLAKLGKLSGKPFVKTLIQVLKSEGNSHE